MLFPHLEFVLILALALAVEAARVHGMPIRASRHAHQNLTERNNKFYLDDLYKGEDFFDDWDFFNGPDPTHGSVNYQTKADAIAKGLAYVQEDCTTVLAVDDKNWVAPGSNRDSIRISSKKTYNGGLFIADFQAMPHGCGVWPAWWSVGPNWPAGGEIDVLEGVHDQPTNQYTLHTSGSPGCTAAADNRQESSAKVINSQCAVSGNDNTGCAFLDTDTRTYGKGFNDVQGGVYVHLWDNSGIRMWHFARGEVPGDISSKKPNPDSWGTPAAVWTSNSCDIASHFYNHVLVIDTTLCGDWAGGTYNAAGCPGSCAERVADPANFAAAKWKINYIAVYQPK